MTFLKFLPWMTASTVAITSATAEVKLPTVLDSRLELTLIAAEPEIVTPIGIAADQRGRIFVVESHTHFPKADYAGPKSDRVKLFPLPDGDGKRGPATIFAEGFHHAMNLACGPDDRLYLVHRNGVVRLNDADGDGVCESRTPILEMLTPGNYPHNGLGGITFSADGWLYVGQGENLGESFTLKGSDGSAVSGHGDGGNIFRCRPDGSKLESFATGFWNPFGLAFFGKEFLLAVDNDPDSRPPNRLLDVIAHGDYGFKFRFGRSGLHPFQSWNGELPGTLPMIAGVGEAASAVLPGDRTRFPDTYRDAVLVTAPWDYRIEVYRPKPFGASLRADREILVQGDETFRPIALAAAPDGAVYFTDWVDASYNLHGKGRLWRLAAKADSAVKNPKPLEVKSNADRRRMTRLLAADATKQTPDLLAALSDADPFIRSAAVSSLAAPQFHGEMEKALTNQAAAIRLGALLALRRAGGADASEHVERLLTDPDLPVRLMAVIWAGERQLTNVAASLPQALNSGQTSLTLLQAHAATAQILARASKTSPPASGTDSEVQFYSLTKKPSADTFIETLRTATQRTPRQTLVEAIRHLAQTSDPQTVALLEQIASDRRRATELRAEAIVALVGVTRSAVLFPLLDDPASAIRIEAARALRLHRAEAEVASAVRKKLTEITGRDVALEEQLHFLLPASPSETNTPVPFTESEWRTRLAGPGDAASGRRVFFNPAVGCATCHQIDGHGGYPGPDLSVITRGGAVDKLMISILDPSRDIPPQFVTHTVTTTDGESYSGLLIGQSITDGVTLLGTDGRAIAIPPARIVAQTQSDVSLMPEGLAQGLTTQDFRDLIAFLLTRK